MHSSAILLVRCTNTKSNDIHGENDECSEVLEFIFLLFFPFLFNISRNVRMARIKLFFGNTLVRKGSRTGVTRHLTLYGHRLQTLHLSTAAAAYTDGYHHQGLPRIYSTLYFFRSKFYRRSSQFFIHSYP